MQLHFKESGEGRAVILLHGLLGSSDNWHHIALDLAKSSHVFVVDQRNHGHSPHSDEMNYPLMAGDLNEFMESHGLETAMIIGHSMGGKTAMQFALEFPQRVEKLVIGDIAPRSYAPVYEKIFAALLALDLKSFSSRQEMEESLAPEIPDFILRRFLLKNLGRNATGEFFWKINLRGLAKNYPQLYQSISHPEPFRGQTLFIRGEESDYINAADELLIRALFPQSEIREIPEAGHWLHAEEPEEFLRVVLNFLGRV